MLIYKVIFKNFKYHVNKFTILFFSIAFSTTCFYLISFVDVLSISLFDNGQISQSTGLLVLWSLPIMMILTIMLLNIVLKEYIRSRSESYEIFRIMGIPGKIMRGIIFGEYILSWFISFILGSLIGKFLSKGMQLFLGHFNIDTINFNVKDADVYSLILSLIMWLVILGCNYLYLKEKSFSESIVMTVKGEESGYIWKEKGLYIGILMFLLGIYLRLPQAAKLFKFFPFLQTLSLIFFICSIYLILTYGGRLLLHFLKTKKQYYYKKILSISGFYYRFQINKNLIFCIFLIHFFVLLIFSLTIIQRIPFGSVEGLYNYDVVWMSGKADKQKASEIREVYEAKETEIPFVYLKTFVGEQYLAISESEYKKLGYPALDLQKGEIYLYSLGGRSFGEKEVEFTVIHDLTNSGLGTEGKSKKYLYKGFDNKVLFIRDTGSVLIMHDEDFESCRREVRFEEKMILQNIPNDVESNANFDISDYQKANRSTLVYCRKSLIQSKNMQDLVAIILAGIIGLVFILYCQLMLGMRILSERDSLKRKYAFLHDMGMPRKELNKLKRSEISKIVFLPVFVLILFTSIYFSTFLVYKAWEFDTNFWTELKRFKFCIYPITGYLVVQFLYYRLIMHVSLKK